MLLKKSKKTATMNAKQLGFYGEKKALSLFRRVGYKAVLNPAKTKRGDLQIVDKETGEIRNLEAKISNAGKNGVFQFCLKRDGRNEKTQYMTDCRYSDYVLLMCIIENGIVPFLIPVADIGNIKKISFANPLETNCKWSKYRLNGSVQLQ